MNKVSVHSSEYQQLSGPTKTGGKWIKYRQKVYVWIEGQPYPKEINRDVWPDRETGVVAPPLPAGDYMLRLVVTGVSRFNEPLYDMVFTPMKGGEQVTPVENKRAAQ